MRGGQDLLDIKDKIILAHCSSGYKGAVQEVLTDEEIAKTIRDTKALREIRILAKFHKMINLDISRYEGGFFSSESLCNFGRCPLFCNWVEFLLL